MTERAAYSNEPTARAGYDASLPRRYDPRRMRPRMGAQINDDDTGMKKVSLMDVPEEGVSHDPQIRKRVLLRRGDLPHVTNFTRSRLAPGQTARAHAHTGMHEVFYIEAGAGRMKVDDEEVPLEAGVCVAIAPGEQHEITSTGADDLVLIYFGVET